MRLTMMDLMGYSLYDLMFDLRISQNFDDEKEPISIKIQNPSALQLMQYFDKLIVNEFEFEPLMKSLVQSVEVLKLKEIRSRMNLGLHFSTKVSCFLRHYHVDDLLSELHTTLHDTHQFIRATEKLGIFEFEHDEYSYSIKPSLSFIAP